MRFRIQKSDRDVPRPWQVLKIRRSGIVAVWYAGATHADAVDWLTRLTRRAVPRGL